MHDPEYRTHKIARKDYEIKFILRSFPTTNRKLKNTVRKRKFQSFYWCKLHFHSLKNVELKFELKIKIDKNLKYFKKFLIKYLKNLKIGKFLKMPIFIFNSITAIF